ncbi:Pesticin receptor precursor [Tsuneonella dongtanensis]|uniref:Pesticin receptor n=1 Tax=Tsuneonella dongtanensis TaxID=692370 RepID=A0A1B2AGC8_9SPHN|nr:TonB-dependent receptor [Tsuneonella dongtanensis]ANY21202.1 Pesticin receptor precursor [Tsuneonella dongtanensis]
MKLKPTVCSGVATLALVTATAAHAQDAAAPTTTDPSMAAADDDGGDAAFGGIVVTAQKRAERVNDVPLSVVALSGAQLERSGVRDVTELQLVVPNLRIAKLSQAAGVTLQIRGFGTGANAAIDSDVATSLDGAFVPRPGAIISTFLDVASVEVLRGPQGTLSGRNAVVGAIAITTNAPDLSEMNGRAEFEYGSFNTFKALFVGNVPVSETFGLRVAGVSRTTDGHAYNLFDKQTYGASTTLAGRLSAKWEITPALTWVGRADYAQITGDGLNPSNIDVDASPQPQLDTFVSRIAAAGGALALSGNTSHIVNQRMVDPLVLDRQYGLSSDLSLAAGNGFEVRLLNSYRDWSNRQNDGDNALTTLDIFYRGASFESRTQNHELQLISPKDTLAGGKLSFVSGLYYAVEDYATTNTINLGSRFCALVVGAAGRPACLAGPQVNAANNQFDQHDRTYAAYAQADFKIFPSLTATLGSRYTAGRKTGSFVGVRSNPGAASLASTEQTTLETSANRTTWRANLTWRPIDGTLVYASYATGFKSGGFNNANSPVALTATTRNFAPETSKNYEIGVKASLFDRLMQLNVNAFLMDIDDFQQRSYDGTMFVIRNAGNIRSKGVEFELALQPSERLSTGISGAYLNSRYLFNPTAPGLPGCSAAVVNSCVGFEKIVNGNPTIQDLTGAPTGIAPDWSVHAFLEANTGDFGPGYRLTLRGDYAYQSALRFSVNGADAKNIGNISLRLDFPDRDLAITGYVLNVTDADYFTSSFPQPLAGVFGGNNTTTGQTIMRGFIGAPREFGLRLGATF